MSQSILPAQAIILNDQGKPVTTSLVVAEVFGKKHFHVLRDIESLGCSSGFHESNFGLTTRETLSGNGAPRSDPYYQITQDGFVFLCMGYTGKTAAKFKEAYIAEFNAMAQALAGEVDDPELVAHLRRTLLAQNPTWAALHRHRLANLPVSQSAKVLECSETTIRQQLRKMDLCGLLPEPIAEPLGARPTTAADHARWLEFYTNGMPVIEIAARENRPASTIRRALARFNSAQRDLFADQIPEVLA